MHIHFIRTSINWINKYYKKKHHCSLRTSSFVSLKTFATFNAALCVSHLDKLILKMLLSHDTYHTWCNPKSCIHTMWIPFRQSPQNESCCRNFYNWQLTGFLYCESILIFQMFMICGDQHLYAWLQLCIFLELIYIIMYKCGCKITFTMHDHINQFLEMCLQYLTKQLRRSFI